MCTEGYEVDWRDLEMWAWNIGVMLPQAKEYWKLPELEEAKNGFSPSTS